MIVFGSDVQTGGTCLAHSGYLCLYKKPVHCCTGEPATPAGALVAYIVVPPLQKGDTEVVFDEMDLSHGCVAYARAIATPSAMAACSSSEPGSGESRMARPSATRLQPRRTASCAQRSMYSPLFQL